MNDSYLFESEASILKVNKHEDGRDIIILDKTIYYPQGGGSPYDQGKITSESSEFTVDEVRFVDGMVYHIGKFTSGGFSTGELVKLHIDSERRIRINQYQSGGHLIDAAMIAVGYDSYKPTKGFHFLEGASVEYEGAIPVEERQELIGRLQAELDQMIDTGYEVQTRIVQKEELAQLCYITPPHLPEELSPSGISSLCLAVHPM